MTENKTKQNDQSVAAFIQAVPGEERRKDCQAILELMQKVTGKEPKMWGGSIVGFGFYHYKYASGREGDMPLVAFSPRKQNLTLYLMGYSFDQQADLLSRLGKHSLGKGCLYIKRLADVDLAVLKELVEWSFTQMSARA